MSAEGVRLTKAQQRFLWIVTSGKAPVRAELGGFALAMADKLAAQGLVTRWFRGFGQWAYAITPAGLAALTAETGGRNEGS